MVGDAHGKPYTPMGLCWCGVTRIPACQPTPSVYGWLLVYPQLGLSGGGSPSLTPTRGDPREDQLRWVVGRVVGGCGGTGGGGRVEREE